MALVCKYCGGTISIKEDFHTIVCDFCGEEQSLSSAADRSGSNIFKNDDVSVEELTTYRRAISILSSAQTENDFLRAAGVLSQIPGVFNAADLAKECRDKADLVRTELEYKTAVADMHSEEPALIERAIRTFESLGKYKDATKMAKECTPLLKIAQDKSAERRRIAEQQRLADAQVMRRQRAKKRIVRGLIAGIAFLVAVCVVVGYFTVYSSSNIVITLSPDDEYVTTSYSGYVFHYDANIENTGYLDVQAIEGTVLFEKEDEVLVDTSISFYNYSSAVVRAGKNSRFTWELTVYSEDTARALYQTPFEDIHVVVEITRITYTDGKTKEY